jgi:hypothetical protein
VRERSMSATEVSGLRGRLMTKCVIQLCHTVKASGLFFGPRPVRPGTCKTRRCARLPRPPSPASVLPSRRRRQRGAPRIRRRRVRLRLVHATREHRRFVARRRRRRSRERTFGRATRVLVAARAVRCRLPIDRREPVLSHVQRGDVVHGNVLACGVRVRVQRGRFVRLFVLRRRLHGRLRARIVVQGRLLGGWLHVSMWARCVRDVLLGRRLHGALTRRGFGALERRPESCPCGVRQS